MTAHEALGFLTASTVRLNVLSELSQPLPETDLVRTVSHSEDSIRSALDGFEQRGWVRKTEEGYTQTGGGAIILRVFDDIAKSNVSDSTIDEEPTIKELREKLRKDLNVLINAPRRVRMLQADSLSSSSTVLGRQFGEDDPSKGSRDRTEFVSRGWYEKNGLAYDRTEKGKTIISGYENLCRTTEQIADKLSFTYRLSSDNADLPAVKLANAELVDALQDGPDAGLTAIEKIGRQADGSTISQIRTVCPIFKPSMGDAIQDFLSFRTETKLVYDQPSFQKMCRPKQMPMLFAALAHPYTDVRVYPGDLSYGIGLYDDQGMVMAYNDYPGNEAGIITEDRDLIGWIDAKFESFWLQSEPLGTEFAKMIEKYADESIWSLLDVAPWLNDRDDSDDEGDETDKLVIR